MELKEIGEICSPVIAEIVEDFEDILYYDGPVLYCGRNANGSRVVGSELWFDREKKESYFVDTVVSDETFACFCAQGISYPQLMRAGQMYLSIKTKDGEQCRAVSFDEIPAQYRPDEDAFCPEEFSGVMKNETGSCSL